MEQTRAPKNPAVLFDKQETKPTGQLASPADYYQQYFAPKPEQHSEVKKPTPADAAQAELVQDAAKRSAKP